MGLVIEGLFALALIVVALWLWSLRSSVAQDQAERQRIQIEAQQARERAAREARLYRKGEKLRCLGCEAQFLGPLPDTGCPQCHIASLVVTEREYQQGKQAEQSVGRGKREE